MDNSSNAPKKKGKINALMIIGVIVMFAGGALAVPAKYIAFAVGAVLAIVGFIMAAKSK